MFKFVVGTHEHDLLKGSAEAEYILGFKGNDIIEGGGGGDIIIGSIRCRSFCLFPHLVYTENRQNIPVDTILDFKSENRDRIDFSDFNSATSHDLAFTGTTPEPFSVYYQFGCTSESDPHKKCIALTLL